jgi:hypothetical protein
VPPVKELHDATGSSGWAVMVKTEPAAGLTPGSASLLHRRHASPGFSGQALETCTGCHDGGLDAVRSRWPLP